MDIWQLHASVFTSEIQHRPCLSIVAAVSPAGSKSRLVIYFPCSEADFQVIKLIVYFEDSHFAHISIFATVLHPSALSAANNQR